MAINFANVNISLNEFQRKRENFWFNPDYKQ